MIDRRDLLKLSAMGLALPSQMSAASKSQGPRVKLKKNVVLVCLDLGLYAGNHREGGAKCKYMNQYFSEFKNEMTFLQGISQPDLGGGHEVQPATFTGMRYDHRNHHPERQFISLDQRLAMGSVQETRNKLLYHQVSKGDFVSWNQFAQPMPPTRGLNAFHEQIFSKTDLDKEKAYIKRERDILESLARNLRRYSKGRPQDADLKASVAYQIETLNEKEKWLKVKKPYLKKQFSQNAEQSPLPNCHHNYRLVYDALEKQQTKIAVLQFGGPLTRNLDGITHGYHTLSHHGGYPERIYELEVIDDKILGGLRKFVRDLKQGGLLDDTIVLFHCGMADASAHSNKNGAAFLFGGGFKHKTHIKCADYKGVKYSSSQLFSSVLKQSGFRDLKFNGNTTVIPELFGA
jgi:hypothetical protein